MASAVQIVNSANAAANIGYPSILVYLEKAAGSLNPLKWIQPFHLKSPDKSLMSYYSVGRKLKTVTLPIPWPIDYIGKKWISSAGLVKRYFLPKYIFPRAKLFYSRDWNFVKEAVKNSIPSVFEWDFPVKKDFESNVVNSDFFKLAVANTNFVKNNLGSVRCSINSKLVKHLLPSGKSSLERFSRNFGTIFRFFLMRTSQR